MPDRILEKRPIIKITYPRVLRDRPPIKGPLGLIQLEQEVVPIRIPFILPILLLLRTGA